MAQAQLLAGIRVLDLSRVFAGPFCTQMLADFGADVIKVERPGAGDESRHQGAHLHDTEGRETDFTPAFVAMNRGKRSVALDIASAEGQALVRALVPQCDVLVENFKTGDLARYGLDWASLSAINPRLVYCSITGFGQTGPRREQPGYDLVFQAMSGVMAMTGHPDDVPGGGPQRIGYSAADITASYHAVIAILAALHARATGAAAGQHIDVSLLDCQVAAASHASQSYLLTGKTPPRVGTASNFMVPYQAFACADAPLVILCGNDAQFARFAVTVGLATLATDPRFLTNPLRLQHRAALLAQLEPAISAQPRQHWIAALGRAGVPCAPVYGVDEAFADPQVLSRGLVQHMPFAPTGELPFVANPLRFSATPPGYGRPPPQLGEHTREVLAELLGAAPERLDALERAGVIAPVQPPRSA